MTARVVLHLYYILIILNCLICSDSIFGESNRQIFKTMLAEPRNRVKYSLNPRGLEWTNDDSKLGQKMLEKMGWKKGNALGLKENGNPEPIKVSTKCDRRGVGCSVKNADNWIAHQDDFSSILAGLNEANGTQDNDQDSANIFSLEQKSKDSRSRVHYQKFAKGKDLSRYETADLQSIFGQRQKPTKKSNSCDQTSKPRQTENSKNDCNKDVSFGVTTVTSSTSIGNYFAQKMAEVKRRLAIGCSNSVSALGVDEDVIGVSGCERSKTKRRQDGDDECIVERDDSVESVQRKKKKKKRKHDVHVEDVEIIDPPGLDERTNNSLEIIDETRKCKKRKRQKTDEHECSAVSNLSTVKKESHINYDSDSPSRKKLNKKRQKEIDEMHQDEQPKVINIVESTRVCVEKHSSKRRRNESQQIETVKEHSKKKKKKRESNCYD